MLHAGVVTERRILSAQPAEPTEHVRIATELRKLADLREGGAKIIKETVENRSIVSHGGRLQRQSKRLDLRFESLFEALSGLHGIGGAGNEVKFIRWAAARANSRQMS